MELVVGAKVEKVELRRVGSVGRAARAVYVQARAHGAGAWVKAEPHAHPLRVLRIAIPRPLYEGAGAAGGGRVGRAVGAVLVRGAGALPASSPPAKTASTSAGDGGLAVHLLFGPRVERRTLEKVLRTLGSGLDEVVVAAGPAAPPVPSGHENSPHRERAPPSAWVAREETDKKKAGKHERGVALLEVRSPVRVAELYKIVAGILPRYSALRTLLLTRPPDAGGSSMMGPSVPPSPRSPSMFVPSPPSTPRSPISPSLRVPPSPLLPPPSPSQRLPPSPWLHAPPSPSLRAPPSPSASLHPPPSPAFTLAPPPGLHTSAAHPDAWAWEWDGWGDAGDVLAGVDAPAVALHALQQHKPLPDVPMDVDVGDDESVMLERGNYYTYGDAAGQPGSGLSREDAAHVAAWRRRCAALECVRMVSGAWWLRE
ncbi:hypothetical protein K438DRAFT_1823006 [Mycena galopus ATCC 62051]|nr:hypothetical protein K438DRAFT_1823006 [Mycena galopus ATCC 62051]